MLSRRVLVDAPGLRVAEVGCSGHGTRWSTPEPVGEFGIVLVRRGVFRRRVDGVLTLADATTAYVQQPGTEQQIAHPAGGDLCTAVALAAQGHDGPARTGPLPVSPAVGLAHRLLLARARAGADPVALVDLATELVALCLGAPRTRANSAGDRRLAGQARELLATDPNRTLADVAGHLGVSPYHLSRVFHRASGLTLARYRIQLRAQAALERLAAGEQRLAVLAADLGFADQAHLTRTLRAETGAPPGLLRAMLAGAGATSTETSR